jgi:hypothetical protein
VIFDRRWQLCWVSRESAGWDRLWDGLGAVRAYQIAESGAVVNRAVDEMSGRSALSQDGGMTTAKYGPTYAPG